MMQYSCGNELCEADSLIHYPQLKNVPLCHWVGPGIIYEQTDQGRPKGYLTAEVSYGISLAAVCVLR